MLTTLMMSLVLAPGVDESGLPNVLIVMADDCTAADLPAYGGRNAVTPNIDRLAAEGLLFERAAVSSAMCQPCRASLYTGLYPARNGCAWNHSRSRPSVRSLPHRLGELGYRVGIAGKVHVKPAAAFPFEPVDGFDGNCVRGRTRPCDHGGIHDFISRDGAPFCLVIALVEPHVPWTMGDPSAYPPAAIELPPNLADTPQTRESFARYLAEITYMDGQVGDVLDTLEKAGRASDTLVLFTSEQGSQFPGNKWTNWDTGLHTALIARWPGVTAAGTRTNALVQYVDVMPTLIEVAGGKFPRDLDGVSFAGVLRGESGGSRRYQYACHNNVPEGPPYPIRSVSDGQYRLVRNLLPDATYIEKHVMGRGGATPDADRYWPSWMWHASEDNRTNELVIRYTNRPAESLYDTAADPYELVDVSGDPAAAGVRETLAAELDRWLIDQQDPGLPQDTLEALQAARAGRHRYGRPPAEPPDAAD